VTDIFDEHAEVYEEELSKATAFAGADPQVYTEAKAELLLETARLRLGTEQVRALDVGCGPGLIHSFLTPRLASLEGCDLSSPVLREAQERNPGVRYTEAHGADLPYEDAAFDLVFTICVLHHVLPSGRAGFLAELARVVRPGGVAVVVEHNRLNPGTRRVVRDCAFDEDAILLPPREVRRRLRGAGLEPLETRYFLFSPWRPNPVRRAERRLSRLPLGAQYAVTAGA
jgi:SAM-dependent methyltransferase